MFQFRWLKVSICCVISLVLCYCVGKHQAPEDTPYPIAPNTDRAAVLKQMADELVIPGYANFKVKLDAMTSKAEQFVALPDTIALKEFRQSWVEAYLEWQKVEAFNFGPADMFATKMFFNIYPTNVSTINANIASGTANLEVSGSFAAQGFPALDYLLNGLAGSNDSIVGYYTSANDAPQRKAYLQKLTAQMQLKFNQVNSEWLSYRDKFVASTGLTASSSLSLVVNGYVSHFEKYIRAGKFGIPAGALTNIKSPEKVEAFYQKDISQQLAKTAIQASIDFFNGKSVKTGIEGASLKNYLDGIGAKDSQTGNGLATTINAQLITAITLVRALDANFYKVMSTDNQKMLDVYSALQAVVRLLKVDMTSAMSITITFTDNDGD
jgi:predicted lipoprotein